MYKGKNIKLARESRRMSQKELADKISTTQATLSKMEKDLITVSEFFESLIADALGYSRSFFELDFKQSTYDSLFYRKRLTISAKDLSALDGNITILSCCIDQLSESIEIPELSIPSIEPNPGKTPEEIAFEIRNFLGVGSGPIGNIVSLFEKNGIVVFFIDADTEKFDGLTKFTANNTPVIWINSQTPNDRKRFSLAHELGHLVMHLRSVDSVQKTEDEREDEANRFASEFLLPRMQCKMDLLGLRFNDLPYKKQYWKVSKQALIMRAHQLGCITDAIKQKYFMNLSYAGERKQELGYVDIDQPKIVKMMVELHLTELDYTLEDLSDMLGYKPKDINRIFLNKREEPRKILNLSNYLK